LPWTGREVEAIAGVLGVGPDRVLLGSRADEGTLKALAGPSILHLATHGFFRPSPEGAAAEWRKTASPIEPLLRSGVALSGANGWQQARDADDGILTALELRDLDLRNTEMVVLSACDTGLGEISYNQAVYGLRRALALAGAKTQIMSLWSIADEPTKDLMVSWYEQMKDGIGRAEALRRVQLAALGGRDLPGIGESLSTRGMEKVGALGSRHPYYWASFILVGE
jgi:CHAT domain-containing protein